MKNIAIVTHKYLPQPDDDLVSFLNRKRGYRIFYIKHSFPDAKDRRSILDLYLNGKKAKEIKTLDYIFLLEPLVYLKDFFFTLKWLINAKRKYDLYIGMDGLCTLFGLLLKSFRVCKKVVYWSIDFVPINRFKNGWENFFYHKTNTFACKKADEVWDLSPRMAEGRKKYLGIDKSNYKLHRVVPYGVWTSRIKTVPYLACEKRTLVFMGHLMKKQGVEAVIKKIPQIIKEIPGFKFKIIGEGRYKDSLTSLARKLSVGEYCDFMGRIGSKDIEKEIAKSSVAIAPYLNLRDSYTYFADSGKIKTYLACGVPVLLTDLPWNAKEIEKNKCGLIIHDDARDLIKSLIFLMQPKVNQEFRENAVKYSKNFDYEKIFSEITF